METAKSSSSKLHSPKCNESTSNDVYVILIFQKNNSYNNSLLILYGGYRVLSLKVNKEM